MDFQKNAKTSLTFVLVAVTLLSVSLIQNYAFAQGQGMEITANAAEGSTSISISGHTATTNNAITLQVMAPNGNRVSVAQVMPDANGDFMTEFQIGGALWKQDGMYTISAQQGSSDLYKLSVNVEIVGGTALETAVSDSTFIDKGSEGIVSATEKPGLTISADAIQGSTTIGISGNTDRTDNSITLQVIAPNGNRVSVAQVMPDANGDFMTEFQIGGALWKQDGFYTIEVQQGESSAYKDSVQVEVIDGAVIPEFGAISAMVLAVAFISIIVVTAKTRLRILPKH